MAPRNRDPFEPTVRRPGMAVGHPTNEIGNSEESIVDRYAINMNATPAKELESLLLAFRTLFTLCPATGHRPLELKRTGVEARVAMARGAKFWEKVLEAVDAGESNGRCCAMGRVSFWATQYCSAKPHRSVHAEFLPVRVTAVARAWLESANHLVRRIT
jgi:hypothetical protein